MRFKRQISAFLCLLMVLSMLAYFALPAIAATSGTTGDCTWTLDGTVLTISGNGAMGDYSYSYSAPWGVDITEVVIEDGVTTIGDYAFENCRKLTSVTIPDSVTTIGSYSFSLCNSLTSVTIPDSVTSIRMPAFNFCSRLTTVLVDEDNAVYCSIDGVLFNKEKTELVLCPDGRKGEYIIPDGVKTIGSYSFYNCDGLTSVTIPDSVTTIGSYSFRDCDGLTSVTIPDSVTTIGYDSFSSCNSLTSVTIPDSVTSMGTDAFSFCDRLTTILVDEDNAVYCSIDGVLFNKEKTELVFCPDGRQGEYVIPDGVKTIGSDSFNNCDRLTSVTIPDSVTTIGTYTFSFCDRLTTILVDEDNAVYCSINGVLFNKEKTELILCPVGKQGEYVIPDGVKTIRTDSFYNCDSLTSVTIPDSVTTIQSNAFDDSGIKIAYIYNLDVSIGNCAFSSSTVLRYISSDSPWESMVTEEGATLVSYRGYAEELIIPKTILKDDVEYPVIALGDNLFKEDQRLKRVTIPDSVTTIGFSAFSGCSSLTEITLPFVGNTLDGTSNTHFGYIFGASSYSSNNSYVPSSLKKVVITKETIIGANAFYKCSGLSSVTIPNSVSLISSTAFSGCSGLTEITLPFIGNTLGGTSNAHFGYIFGASSYSSNNSYVPSSLEKVVITKAITIGSNAFYNCSGLTSVTIPNSVTTIRDNAFDGCNRLTTILVDEDNAVYSSIDGTLFNKEKTELILCPSGKQGEYSIPSGVITIGDYAFENCRKLTSVTIPDSVPTIGSYAFSDCTGLTSITIPDSVTTIGSYAFSNCTGLTSITIPDSVTTISSSAFSGCSNLTEITLPFVGNKFNGTSNTHFGYIFGASSYSSNRGYVPSSLKKVVITKATTIDANAFYNCSGLTSVTIPDSVTTIGSYAFYGCSSLTEITLPFVGNKFNGTSNTHFGYIFGASSYSYNRNYVPSSLEKVVITKATTIDANAFYNCSGLTSVTIPDSVTAIGSSAFSDCSALEEVHISDLTAWCKIAFSSNTSNPLINGAGLYLNGELITDLVIPEGITTIYMRTFRLYVHLESVTLPSTVTSIEKDAFYKCTSLKEVRSSSLIGECTIATYAFGGCTALTSIVLPDGVTALADNVFANCAALTSVTLPKSLNSVVSNSIPTNAVWYVYENSYAHTYAEAKKKTYYLLDVVTTDNITYYIQDGFVTVRSCENWVKTAKILDEVNDIPVTTIGDAAFADCKWLSSVTIPKTVSHISASAFPAKTVWNVYENSYAHVYAVENGIPYTLADVFVVDGITYYIQDGVVTVRSCDTSVINAVILSEVNGYAVTSIADGAFASCTTLETVAIPASVVVIGQNAFEGCDALPAVVLPSTVETLYDTSFPSSVLWYVYENSSAHTFAVETEKNYRIWSGEEQPVIFVEEGVVYFSQNNKAAVIDASLATGDVALLNEVGGCTVTIIEETAFNGSNGVTSVTIPKYLEIIPASAIPASAVWYVYENSTAHTYAEANDLDYALADVFVIDGLTYYLQDNGTVLVRSCDTSLTEAVILEEVKGRKVTAIGDSAFNGCSTLSSVTIPVSITSIGHRAFYGCSRIISLTLPEALTFIGDYAFYSCPRLTTISIPDGVTSIGDYTFYGGTLLNTVALPKSLTTIGDYAFYNCKSLVNISVPASVSSIGSHAFQNCTKITTIGDLSGLTSLGGYAFYGCSVLEEVVLPDTVTEIGEYTFSNCTALQKVVLSDKVTSIGEGAFYYCRALNAIHLPSGITEIRSYTFYNCSSLRAIIIPEGVTSIGYDAFNSCYYVSYVELPSTLTYVGSGAFNWTYVSSVVIPEGLQTAYTSSFNSSTVWYVYEYSDVHLFVVENDIPFALVENPVDYVAGDFSGDDEVNLLDAVLLLQKLSGTIHPSQDANLNLRAGNVINTPDSIQEVNTLDLSRLLSYLSGNTKRLSATIYDPAIIEIP